MKGRYYLEIYDNKVRYELLLERNITVIKGKSGTGKSTLYTLISNMLETSKARGIHCNCKDKLRILDYRTDWKSELENESNKIFIADESVSYITTNEFARYVNKSDNYFIFITRSGILYNLGYSVNSLFELSTTKENGFNVTKLIDRFAYDSEYIKPNLVIVEDSNSGFDMMKIISNCRVLSGNGNSGVYKVINENLGKYNNICVIVDGAAFGAYIEQIIVLRKFGVYLFTPESFEFLLLQYKSFYNDVKQEIERTYDFCDSKHFSTWERYYTSLLENICESKYNFKYSKKKLNKFFQVNEFKVHILNIFKDIDFSGGV